MTFEQRLKGGERMSYVGIWSRSLSLEDKENNKEASMAGMKCTKRRLAGGELER